MTSDAGAGYKPRLRWRGPESSHDRVRRQVLSLLAETPGLTAAQLARLCKVSAATMATVLKAGRSKLWNAYMVPKRRERHYIIGEPPVDWFGRWVLATKPGPRRLYDFIAANPGHTYDDYARFLMNDKRSTFAGHWRVLAAHQLLESTPDSMPWRNEAKYVAKPMLNLAPPLDV